jgi:hypothetical protein
LTVEQAYSLGGVALDAAQFVEVGGAVEVSQPLLKRRR